MPDWKFVQRHPSESLAKLHFFSVTKKHSAGEIEIRITIKEFTTVTNADFAFFAQADIELNQNALPFRPCGWHRTLMGALDECMRNVRRFDFDHPNADTAVSGN